MKKYSWIWVVALTLAFIVFAVAASKNEAVRDTFMKAEGDFFAYAEQMAIKAQALMGRYL